MGESFAGLEFAFALFLRTAWCAAILLLLVWLIQKAGARWLSPRARYALWLLVAARLVILWTPPSSLSLVGQLEQRVANVFAPQEAPTPQVDLAEDPLPIADAIELAPIASSVFARAELAPAPAQLAVKTWDWSDLPIWSIVAAIWALGALAFSLRLARDFWRLRREVIAMKPTKEPRVVQLVRRIEQELGLIENVKTQRRSSPLPHVPMGERVRVRGIFRQSSAWSSPVRVLVSDQIASPAVTGVFRPALLMPAQFISSLSVQELEHVIRHELTHVKRRDVLVNWLLAAIGAVYWFFPLMRYLLSQLRKTRELACDAAVLRSANANERKAYGKTLLKIMEMVSETDRPMLTFTVGVAGMVWPMGSFRKESKMMRERLELVVMDRSKRGRAGWLVGAMALMLIAVGFTEAQETKKANAAGEVAATAFVARNVADGSEYRWIETSYDFTSTRKLFEKSPEFYKMPAITSAAPSPGAPPVKIDAVVSARQVMREWVERVIKESGWTARMDPTITWHEDKAAISHSYHSHERLARALKALHATPESQYVFEFSMGAMDAEDFGKVDMKEFRVAAHKTADASAELAAPKSASAASHSEVTISRRVPNQRLILNDDQTKRLQSELEGIRSFNRIAAPKVTTLNTQSASVTTGTERPFVTGLVRDKDGKEQPQYESVFCGIDTDLQAVALGDAAIWLRLNCRHTEVIGVTEEEQPGSALKIQSPKIWLMSQAAGLEMKSGETLAIFSKASGREGKKDEMLVLFVTVREAVLPPLPAPLGPDGEPLKTTTVRTEVFDVSRTPSLLWFTKTTTTDDPLRKKLIAPAFEQLEILIKETIDPESPKIIKRSTENLTLEVTASQEVLEKVHDLIKQLVRLADREKTARPKGVTVTYDVSDFFSVCSTKSKGGKQPDDVDCGDPFFHIFALFGRALPNLVPGKDDVELLPLWDAKTVTVTALPEIQEKISEAIKFVNKLSVEDAKQFIEGNNLLADPSGRPAGSIDEHGNILQCYEVHDQPLFAGVGRFVKDGDPKREQAIAQGEKLVLILRVAHPEFFDEKRSVGLQIFPTNQTLVVNAPHALHEKVQRQLKRLAAMTLEDCEKEARRANGRPVDYVAPKAESEETSNFNELRMGVEFVPPQYGKARAVNGETRKVADANDAPKMEQAIHRALQHRVEVKFTDKPLREVLKVLGETTKINIVIDPAGFVDEGIQTSEPVSLHLQQPVSMRKALQLVLEPLNLDFVVKYDALVITSKRRTQSSLTTVAYDVAGSPFLKPLLPDFKNGKHPDEEKVAAAVDKIQALVKNTIPCFVEGDKGAEIQPFYTNLTVVVSAPPEDQEKIAGLLKQLERVSLADAEKAVEDSKRR